MDKDVFEVANHLMEQIITQTPLQGCVDSRKGGRLENQDTCGYADTPLGFLAVVCDGMGGGPGGKLASSASVDAIINYVRLQPATTNPRKALEEALRIANQSLLNITAKKPALRGMGTTATILLLNERSAVAAHIGDSRIYQFRRGGKKFRTFDHSRVFERVRHGSLTEEQARLDIGSNIITRALGLPEDPRPDIAELPYEKGDRFMLCTDGVWGAMPEKELIKIVAGTPDINGAMESLFIHVDEIGMSCGNTHDNFSAIFVETSTNSILKEKMSTKTRNIFIGLLLLCGCSIALNFVAFSSLKNQKSSAQQTLNDSIRALNDSVDKWKQSYNFLRGQNGVIERNLNKAEKERNEAREDAGKAKKEASNAKEEAERAKKDAKDARDAAEKAKQNAKVTGSKMENHSANKSARRQSIINTLDKIINQAQQLTKDSGKKTAVSNSIKKEIKSIESDIKTYGGDTYHLNSLVKSLSKNTDLKTVCSKIIGEAKAQRIMVENSSKK